MGKRAVKWARWTTNHWQRLLLLAPQFGGAATGENTSSEDNIYSPSIVSQLFIFPMLPHKFSVIKHFISLVLKCSRKEINLAEQSFLYWNGPRIAESGLNPQPSKNFLTTAKQDGGTYNSLKRGFSHWVFSPFGFRAISAVFLGRENILPPTDSNLCLSDPFSPWRPSCVPRSSGFSAQINDQNLDFNSKGSSKGMLIFPSDPLKAPATLSSGYGGWAREECFLTERTL